MRKIQCESAYDTYEESQWVFHVDYGCSLNAPAYHAGGDIRTPLAVRYAVRVHRVSYREGANAVGAQVPTVSAGDPCTSMPSHALDGDSSVLTRLFLSARGQVMCSRLLTTFEQHWGIL